MRKRELVKYTWVNAVNRGKPLSVQDKCSSLRHKCKKFIKHIFINDSYKIEIVQRDIVNTHIETL